MIEKGKKENIDFGQIDKEASLINTKQTQEAIEKEHLLRELQNLFDNRHCTPEDAKRVKEIKKRLGEIDK